MHTAHPQYTVDSLQFMIICGSCLLENGFGERICKSIPLAGFDGSASSTGMSTKTLQIRTAGIQKVSDMKSGRTP